MARWAYIILLAGYLDSLVAEQCQDSLSEPVGKDCSKFRNCRGGQWIEMTCSPPRELFDPIEKKCVSTVEYKCPLQSTLSSCRTEGEVRPNEQCTRYDVCLNKSWVTYQCQNGYAYDTTTSSCVREEKAMCYGCEKNQPNLDDCNSFFTCQGTKKIKISCGWFKHFDSVTRECVWFGAECQPLGTCEEENKKIPTSNCKEYLQCKSGSFYKKTCGFSHVFDSIKGICVFVWPWHRCVNTSGEQCTEGQTKILGCRSYYKCVSGVWHAQKCREGEIITNGQCVEEACTFSKHSCNEYTINGQKLICGSGHYFDTIMDRCTSGLCDDRTSRNYELACTEHEVRGVKGTCKNYTVCTNGALTEHVCDKCQNFDNNKNKCMFVWDSPCTDGSPTPTSHTTDTSPPTSHTTDTPPPTSHTTDTPPPTSHTTDTPPPTSHTTDTPPPTSHTTDTPPPTSHTTDTPPPTSHTTDTPPPTSHTTDTPPPTSHTTDTPPPTTPAPCEIGSLKPDLLSCHRYYLCDKNQSWEHKKCATIFFYFYFFDADTLSCKFWDARCAT